MTMPYFTKSNAWIYDKCYDEKDKEACATILLTVQFMYNMLLTFIVFWFHVKWPIALVLYLLNGALYLALMCFKDTLLYDIYQYNRKSITWLKYKWESLTDKEREMLLKTYLYHDKVDYNNKYEKHSKIAATKNKTDVIYPEYEFECGFDEFEALKSLSDQRLIYPSVNFEDNYLEAAPAAEWVYCMIEENTYTNEDVAKRIVHYDEELKYRQAYLHK